MNVADLEGLIEQCYEDTLFWGAFADALEEVYDDRASAARLLATGEAVMLLDPREDIGYKCDVLVSKRFAHPHLHYLDPIHYDISRRSFLPETEHNRYWQDCCKHAGMYRDCWTTFTRCFEQLCELVTIWEKEHDTV